MALCPQCSAWVTQPKTNLGYCSLACRLTAGALLTGKRKVARRVARPTKPTELQEHLRLARWLESAGVLWCHPPNGELRAWSVARRLKGMGVKPGVPDVLIFTPPPLAPTARGVAVELKRQGVTACSAEQKAWMAALKEAGWLAQVCAGAEQATLWLESLGF
jgi:hypothetical protein